MKIKCFIYLFITLGFIACSDDTSYNQPKEQDEINSIAAYTPLPTRVNKEQKDLLGKGYDFTGAYVNYQSTREQVIDITKYKAENEGTVYNQNTSEGSNYTVSGATAWQYSKSLTSKTNNSYWTPLADSIALFTGSILDNESLKNIPNAPQYSFASIHFYHILKTNIIGDTSINISRYLTETFKDDLQNLSGEQIIEKYGTHIICYYSIGARLDLIYRSKVKQEHFSNDYYTEKIVQSGLRNTINKIGYWSNGPVDPPTEEDIKKNQTPILYVENQGGDNSLIACGTYNLQKEYPKINIDTWFASLSEENAALIELPFHKQIPIYELITDKQKKAEVKSKIEKYIIKRQR